MESQKKKSNLVTPKARLSFPSLFEARSFNEQAPKFSATLIFDDSAQKDAAFTALKKAAEAAAVEKWGPREKWPKKLRSPFRDGAEKDLDGYGPGKVFLNVSSKQKPKVVDHALKPIEDPDEVYAGCYVKASLRPYAYDNSGNQGVAFGLQNVQKVDDGEPFGGASRPEDDFTPVAKPVADLATQMGLDEGDVPF